MCLLPLLHPYLLVQMKVVSNVANLSHEALGRILHSLLPLYFHPEGQSLTWKRIQVSSLSSPEPTLRILWQNHSKQTHPTLD